MTPVGVTADHCAWDLSACRPHRQPPASHSRRYKPVRPVPEARNWISPAPDALARGGAGREGERTVPDRVPPPNSTDQVRGHRSTRVVPNPPSGIEGWHQMTRRRHAGAGLAGLSAQVGLMVPSSAGRPARCRRAVASGPTGRRPVVQLRETASSTQLTPVVFCVGHEVDQDSVFCGAGDTDVFSTPRTVDEVSV
jgi:hypothetical protein